MDYVYSIVSNVKYFYTSLNSAVLSGAIDVVVVEQPDGTYLSTPFHIRFGKYGVFTYDDKYVDIRINGVEIDLKMKLGENGVAFFVAVNSEQEQVPRSLATSPLPEDSLNQRNSVQNSSECSHIDLFSDKLNKSIETSLSKIKIQRRYSTANDKPAKKFTRKQVRSELKRCGIYSGSYSDSEIERRKNRKKGATKHEPEWKWGKFPESKKLKELKKMQQMEEKAKKSHNYRPSIISAGKLDRLFDNVTSPTSSDFYLSDEDYSAELIMSNYKRSLKLSSDQLRSLNLNYGSNEARFSITTKFQGTAWCSCHIYLLKWSEQLVISDIDGTITKSDVLGHVIPAIGGTWAHAGVAELYTHIKANGYRMIYLSSRAIGMSHHTKNYLKTVKQGTKMLPDGPVLLSPTSVLMALRKEVIERRPEEFKIACLTDLKALFPNRQPFYAGFGNRITDVTSYLAVGILPERILIINSSGTVSRADRTGYTSDYATMANAFVDFIFPPLFFHKFASNCEKDYDKNVLTRPEDSILMTTWKDNASDSLSQLMFENDLETYLGRRNQIIQKRSLSVLTNSSLKK